MQEGSLRACGVTKRFFRKSRESARYFDAVAPCDFDLRRGEIVALTGRSGSGKSTLLNMLAGLLEPSGGTVELGGRSIYELDDASLSRLRNESFGVIPQGQSAIHSLTVLENVLLPIELYRKHATMELKARELLDRLRIADLAESYPRELSGGELRRMAIARALIGEPEFVFADEPTADLDDESTEIVGGFMRSIADGGAGVFIVTHEHALALAADRTFKMDAGRLFQPL